MAGPGGSRSWSIKETQLQIAESLVKSIAPRRLQICMGKLQLYLIECIGSTCAILQKASAGGSSTNKYATYNVVQ